MLSLFILAGALAAGDCGALSAQEAGGDYNDGADRAKLSVVEAFHFTPDVENLKRGATGSLGDDIGYTLDHFPNHARALAAMMRLGQREKTIKPAGARYSLPCYFDRAIRFRPSDPAPRSLYGAYLLAAGRAPEALAQFEEVVRVVPGDATAHYNLGLLLLAQKKYGPAREHARVAYELGFPLPGLKNKLVEAHQWDAPD
jgi:tetratricopeptide (TPR) repeat protein